MVVAMVGVMVGCNRPTVPKNPTYPQTEGDFLLTISTSFTTPKQDQALAVGATFKNFSGERYEITHGPALINFFIVNHSHYYSTTYAPMNVIEKDAEFVIAETVGGNWKKGKYELIAVAEFATREPFWFFKIYSNTIILTVK